MLGMLLYKVPWLLSLRFVGNIGAKELAAAALATTLCNVTGMSLSVGLSSALTTLTGQARGDLIAKQEKLERIRQVHYKTAEEKKLAENEDEETPLLQTKKAASYNKLVTIAPEKESLPLTYLYRGIFIQMVLVIPIGLWWLWGIKPVLLALGQGELLSEMTEKYLRILTPGLWSYSINWTLTAWLQAIEMAHVPAYAAFVGLVLHVPMNLFFIHVLHWGYLGVAVATVMFQLIQPFVMLVYLFGTRHGSVRVLKRTTVEKTSLSFRKEAKLAVGSIAGICQYLSLAIPGIIIISEWWASEISIFLAGRLQPNPAFALDGMTIYQSINTFCFMFPVGVSVAGSTRVGNLLGSGDVEGAKFAAEVNIVSAGCLSSVMGSVLYLTPHTLFPSFFSPDQDVILETSRTIPLLAVYAFADGIQVALNGIIKGCGRQCVTMPIVVIAYWVVGVPLAYHIAFNLNDGYMSGDNYFCGIVGLVAGMTTGTWVHLLLLAVVVLGTTNWTLEAQKAQARVALEHENHLEPPSPMIQREDVSGVQHLNI